MRRLSSALVLVLLLGFVTACGSSGNDEASTAAPATSAPATSAPGTSAPATPPSTAPAACPTEPVPVAVSVDQWADVVRARGGTCAEVTAVITGTAADPHDYEPTAADTATIAGAGLVVVNGADFDHWAADAVDAAGTDPRVLDIAELLGVAEGENPHFWYDPEAVDRVADAVTEALRELRPEAASYLDARVEVADELFAPYFAAVDEVKATADGRRYAATETVFDLMAAHLGMVNGTPPGYVASSLDHHAEPTPGDLAAFERVLRGREVDVLIVNTQTASAVTDQLRGVAEQAGIPIVEVTETLPPGTDSFVDWQVAQLRALEQALTR